jgi:hypothetical protein
MGSPSEEAHGAICFHKVSFPQLIFLEGRMVNYDKDDESPRYSSDHYPRDNYGLGGPLMLTLLSVFVVGMLIYAFVGTSDMRARYNPDVTPADKAVVERFEDRNMDRDTDRSRIRDIEGSVKP